MGTILIQTTIAGNVILPEEEEKEGEEEEKRKEEERRRKFVACKEQDFLRLHDCESTLSLSSGKSLLTFENISD